MQHFCGCMEMPSLSSAVLPLTSSVPVPFPLGHTHLQEVPGGTWPPRSSAIMLVYVWQFLVTKQVWRMQGLQSEPLYPSRPKSVSVPLCLCGISLHQVECWAQPLLVLTVNVFFIRTLKPEVCARHESSGPRNESITLSVRFNVPMEITYVCISSCYLKLVSGAYFPLACAPSPLSTADKVSKFPLLMLWQMQSQFTSLHFPQSKKSLGNILN